MNINRSMAITGKTAWPQLAHPRWPRTCVVVADTGAARIFRASRTSGSAAPGTIQLQESLRLDNRAARVPGRALVTDRTGRVFDSGSRAGQGPKSRARHGAQSDYDPHDVEVERFARRLARRLDLERRRMGYEELVVVAAPRFLGELRQYLSAPTRRLVRREVDRDLVRADIGSIRRAAFTGAR
jgi:protein required for attachment to host cells